MSAIVGVRQLNGRAAQTSIISRMLQAMARRSPDGMTVWQNGLIALGHGLLQTVSGSPVVQPFIDGELVITADVRLDNRDELLAALGLPNDKCDAAVIIAAYRRWGERCPQHLLGDFAFALWDGRSATLFCARDHFGVKPFYYHVSAERMVFASEIKALLTIPELPREINEAKIADFLAAIVSDDSSTLYSDIFRLPAGHYLMVTSPDLRAKPYWRLEAPAKLLVGDPTENFLSLFTKAVRCRLGGATSVGVMLSGGLDSSSIACVAASLLRDENARPLSTFSLVFDKTPLQSERAFIDEVVGQGWFSPCFLDSDCFPVFADFDQFLVAQEGPFLAPSLTISSQIHRAAAARGIRVLLDGHGGDEVVSHGFGRLKELANNGQWINLWQEVQAEAAIYGTPGWRGFATYLSHFGPSGRVLRPLRRVVRKALGPFRRPAQDGPAWSRFINPQLVKRTAVEDRYLAQTKSMNACQSESEQHFNTLSAPWRPYGLEVLDKVAAASGVEVRFPFWDKRLVEFCLALPANAKLSGGWTRLILRRAMEGILPDAIQWRRDKFDFNPHVIRGMLRHHRSMLDDVLLKDAENIGEYVDLHAVTDAYYRVLNEAESTNGQDFQAVWRTAVLALWLRQRRGEANIR
jgi:asparagine synthase (glutamine-hydrolysing)